MWNDEVKDTEDIVDSCETSPVKKRNKRKAKRKGVPMPPEISDDLELRKYWGQRYRLFSRFDEGVKLDRGRLYY